jgi:hypothetical protein
MHSRPYDAPLLGAGKKLKVRKLHRGGLVQGTLVTCSIPGQGTAFFYCYLCRRNVFIYLNQQSECEVFYKLMCWLGV